MRRAVRGEVVKNQVIDIIRPDSQQLTMLGNASPLFNEEGEPRGAVGAFLDITALKQAKQELRTSEARLALVVEEVNAGYWDWDLTTRQLFLSPEMKRQIGFDDSESLNRREDWESRLHPDDRAHVIATIKNCVADRKPNFEMEFRLQHKDGSYRWIHSRGVLLSDKNNQTYRILGINLDITDYMKQKELNERRDKMEQSSRLYVAVQTAAAFAHELNQPLSAISSYADVALHLCRTDQPDSQKLCQVMEKCSQQAQRAGEVIRQLVSLLQKGESDSEPVDINCSVREAIDLMKTDGLSDEFKIELDLAVELPPVRANALQIQKVLINLLRNGLESMLEQRVDVDKIIVTTQRDEVDPAMIRVTVRDSGKGIEDPAELRNIFQPFHSTKSAGLGMGLTISRTLVMAHGGKMWAEQNAGNGLSVNFTLPCAI